MASRITGNVLQSATRGYAAAAAAAPKAASELNVSQLQSGALVASKENHSPLSRVSVFVRGGSSANNFSGASTMFKQIVTEGFSTPNHTGLHLTRMQEAYGLSLEMESDRELMIYHGSCTRDNVSQLFSLLSNLTSNNQYRPYECPVHYPFPMSVDKGEFKHDRIKAIMASVPPETHALDLAFKAAFRSQPLGRSEIIPDYVVPAFRAPMINDYVSGSHGSSGIVVVGTGIEHSLLEEGAATFGVLDGASTKLPSKYHGGDARVDAGGNTACVVIAGEGAPFGSDLHAASLVAAELLSSDGVSPCPLAAAAGGMPVEGLAEAYFSSGLLGVRFTAGADEVAKVSSSIGAALKGLTVGDLTGAKNTAKAKLLAQAGAGETKAIGAQLMQTGACKDMAAAVDKVSAADVTKVVKNAFGGKLSVAAYGNVDNVPYSDSI